MSIANPGRSAPGLQNFDTTVPVPMTTVMKHRCDQVITKLLFGAAIARCPGVTGAAPASADPHSVGSDPNLFSTLSCSCPETSPAGSPVWRD
jgi:hypothetical protein